jgi:hypothetical protein
MGKNVYKRTSIAIALCTLAGGLSVPQAQATCGDVVTTPKGLKSDLTFTIDNPALTRSQTSLLADRSTCAASRSRAGDQRHRGLG